MGSIEIPSLEELTSSINDLSIPITKLLQENHLLTDSETVDTMICQIIDTIPVFRLLLADSELSKQYQNWFLAKLTLYINYKTK